MFLSIFSVYAPINMNADYKSGVVIYTITTTDSQGNLAPLNGDITIKKGNTIIWSETRYSLGGVLENTFQTSGPGTYSITFVEKGTNKIASATITVARETPQQDPVNGSGDKPDDPQIVGEIMSFQHPICYGVVILLIVAVLFVLKQGFKPKKKDIL
jgi:hypothetical protein